MDLSFDPGSGVNGPVNVVAVQPDGKVVIGGQFTTVKGLTRTNLARLNADGSGDATFEAGASSITALALQADGKLLVGGIIPQIYCDEFGCQTYHTESVVRLHVDGSRDTDFTPVTADSLSQSTKFLALVPLPDGKLLVGGEFFLVNGVNRVGIARIHADGTLDPTFDTGVGPNGNVASIVLQPDGRLLINGSFSMVNGTNHDGLARLNTNGSLDPSFDAGLGGIYQPDCGSDPNCFAQTIATAVALQSDDKLLVGLWSRSFSIENDLQQIVDRYWVARFHADGSHDPGFGAASPLALIGDILVQSDGSFLVRHGFNSSQVLRLNPNGSLDDSFNAGVEPGSVEAVAFQPDGKVLIGGTFAAVNGANRNRIARLDADGSADTTFDPGQGLTGAVSQLVLQPDGRVLMGGPLVLGDPYFGPPSDVLAFVNGTNRHGRARLKSDGSLDTAFNPTPFHPPLEARYHTENCLGDPRYGCLHGFISTALLVQADGKVLISGNFITTITGDEVLVQIHNAFLGRFTATGGLEEEFNLPDAYVTAMAQQPDAKIVIGGSLALNGANYPVARLNADGGVDDSFQLGQGPASVVALALQSDGGLIVAGTDMVVRLNSDGSRDPGFGPVAASNGSVACLALQSDGRVLIAGSFTSVNGTTRNRIARLRRNGTLDDSFNPGDGPDNSVVSIALQSDGHVLIAGGFRTVSGVVRPYVARLFGDSPFPSLALEPLNTSLQLSWPVTALNIQLQETTDLALPDAWTAVEQPAVSNAGRLSVIVPFTGGHRYFRLKSQ